MNTAENRSAPQLIIVKEICPPPYPTYFPSVLGMDIYLYTDTVRSTHYNWSTAAFN